MPLKCQPVAGTKEESIHQKVPPGFNDLVARKARELAELLTRYVVPLFRVDNSGNPDFEGSGVLALVGGAPFVVSAAHVLGKLSNGVHLLLKGREQSPLATPHRVTLCKPPMQRESDLYDLGWCPLTEAEYAAADPDNFIAIQGNEVDNIEWFYRYFVLGYPAKDQVPNHDTSIYFVNQTYYTAPRLRVSKARQAGLNLSMTVSLDFAHSQITGPKGSGGRPNFKGMSGCGIWQFSPYEQYTISRPPQLIGFLAGSPPKNSKALFGGNTRCLTTLIASA